MSYKGAGKSVITISTLNAYAYIEALDNFLILSFENRFSNEEVIFQDDKASCCRAKEIKGSSSEKANKINDIASEQSGFKSY